MVRAFLQKMINNAATKECSLAVPLNMFLPLPVRNVAAVVPPAVVDCKTTLMRNRTNELTVHNEGRFQFKNQNKLITHSKFNSRFIEKA